MNTLDIGNSASASMIWCAIGVGSKLDADSHPRFTRYSILRDRRLHGLGLKLQLKENTLRSWFHQFRNAKSTKSKAKVNGKAKAAKKPAKVKQGEAAAA